MQGAGTLAELVDGDWSEDASWDTAAAVVEGFMAYWERQPGRVPGGRARHRGGRPALPGAAGARPQRRHRHPGPGHRLRAGAQRPAGTDAMAVAGTLISMLAHVAAHRYGFEFWGIRTTAMVDTQARVLHWAVTGRPAPAGAKVPGPRPAPRTGPVVGGGAGSARTAQVKAASAKSLKGDR